MVAPPIPTHRTRIPGAYGCRVRLWRADRFGNKLGLIPNDGPITGSISYNASLDVKHQFSLTLNDPERFVDFRDYIIPEITLVKGDGSKQVRDWGLYMVTPPSVTFEKSGRLWGTIEGKDATWQLTVANSAINKFAAGMDYGDAARQTAILAGFREDQLSIPDTFVTMNEDYRIEPGLTCMALMKQLLERANWYPPTMMMEPPGKIRSFPRVPLTHQAASSTYGTSSGFRLIPPVTSEPDWSRLRNTVRVRVTRHEKDTIYATARITNQSHRMYYDPYDKSKGCGFELGELYDETDITVTQALAIARSRLSEHASYLRKLRCETIVDMKAWAYDVVNLDIRRGDNLVYGGKWHREGWSIVLGQITARMRHDLYRVEEVE